MYTAWVTGILIAAIPCLRNAYGQSAGMQLTFEAASIKPSAPYDPSVGMRVRMSGGPGTSDPGRLTIENFSLPNLITAAYDIRFYQLSAQNLSNTETFNISAIVPDGTTKEQFHIMFQNLLADRFRLAVHHEKKEMPVFELVLGKGGPKMMPSPNDAVPPDGAASASGGARAPGLGSDGYPVLGEGTSMAMMNGRARMRATKESMEKFAGMLSGQLGRPVEDRTGLAGEYDFGLYWSAEGARAGPSAVSANGGALPAAAEIDSAPTLMEAIQDQLGLKLQQAKGQVDVLVVDHVEKTPTGN